MHDSAIWFDWPRGVEQRFDIDITRDIVYIDNGSMA